MDELREAIKRALQDAAMHMDRSQPLRLLDETATAYADAALAAIEASGTHRLITTADYKRLVDASEADDMIVRCEVCGAWLDQNDPATAMLDDFIGCWKAATRDEKHSHLCRSYRALDPEPRQPGSGAPAAGG